MPLDIKQLKLDVANVSFDFVLSREGDKETYETVNLKYRPSVYTPDWEKNLSVSQDDPTNRSGWLADFCAQLIIEWDVQDADGTPYPLTVARLRELPVSFLAFTVGEIASDMGKAQAGSKTG